MSSRLLPAVAAALVLAACSAPRPAAPATGGGAADFDRMWTFVRDHYAYFAEKQTDWDAVGAAYRPLAATAVGARAQIAMLEAALDELYDPHCHLSTNLATSWRLPPYDLWAEWRDDVAVVTDVRAGSAAAAAGLAPGAIVVAVDGVAIRDAAAARGPHHLRAPDPEAMRWALLSVLSGRHDRDRRLTVRGGDGSERAVTIPDRSTPDDPPPALEARMLDGRILWVRIASFGDTDTIAAFDAALDAHRDAGAIVFDVRANPGGDTAVAVPIMGRLVATRVPYAQMARRDGDRLGARWTEYVEPRGPWTFTGPVAVVVDRFSQSMAEGFAMGLAGMGRAVVVGDGTTGLGAGVAREHLPGIDADVQISAEPVYHLDGTPRERWRPQVVIAPAAGRDVALEAAIAAVAPR